MTSTAHTLRLETSTPAGGPSEFVNTLNPRIDLSGTAITIPTELADWAPVGVWHGGVGSGTQERRVVVVSASVVVVVGGASDGSRCQSGM